MAKRIVKSVAAEDHSNQLIAGVSRVGVDGKVRREVLLSAAEGSVVEIRHTIVLV